MALGLRLEEGAERNDFPATAAGFLDGVKSQRLTDPLAAQGVRHAGMIDDDKLGEARENVISAS